MKFRFRSAIMALLLVFFTLIAVLNAFAANTADDPRSAALAQRAKEYWAFKVKGEFDKALPYEDPARVKGIGLTDYTRSVGGGVKWISAEPGKIVIEGNKGSVYLNIKYTWTFVDPAQQMGTGMPGAFWDNWTFIDGKWYHRFKSFQQSAEQLGAKKVETPAGDTGQAGGNVEKEEGQPNPAAPK